MELTIGTTYKVVATPKDKTQYKCEIITITGLEEQPKTTVDENGVGTCTFEMKSGVEAIDAKFEAIEPPTPQTEPVTIGNGTEDPEGTALSVDKHGTVTVSVNE